MTATVDQLPEIRTGLFIDGETMATGDALRVVDPADGVSVVGYAAAATAAQAAEAVAAADRAFPAWAALDPAERAERVAAALAPLEADRPATAAVLTRENGKIRMESVIDSIVFEHRCRLAVELATEVDASHDLTHTAASGTGRSAWSRSSCRSTGRWRSSARHWPTRWWPATPSW